MYLMQILRDDDSVFFEAEVETIADAEAIYAQYWQDGCDESLWLTWEIIND